MSGGDDHVAAKDQPWRGVTLDLWERLGRRMPGTLCGRYGREVQPGKRSGSAIGRKCSCEIGGDIGKALEGGGGADAEKA